MKKLLFVVSFLLIVSAPCLSSCGENQISYISNTADFLSAIQAAQSTIYVDDLSFDTDTTITLNYPVTINGKENKSRISNLHISLEATAVSGQTTPYYFNNIIFDGMVDESSYNFSIPDQTFYSMFGGNRSDKRCINVAWGYPSINLYNCEITRYATYDAPTISIDNDVNFALSERYINIDNCSFHHNICYEGGLKIYHEKAVTNVTNSTFSNNLCKNAGGLVVSNGKASLDNLTIVDNKYYKFINNNASGEPIVPTDKIEISGKQFNYCSLSGSLYVGAADVTVSNCYIARNKNLFGGGLGFATPQVTSENQKMEFKNNIIVNNEAVYGGAIYAKSLSGTVAKIINCDIQNNKAQYQSVMYATTLIPWLPSRIGGVIDLMFVTIAANDSFNAGNSFVFQELIDESCAGQVRLRGSFVVDDSTYSDLSVNYVDNKASAINDGVVTLEQLENANTTIVKPIENSKGDMSIKPEEYKTWDDYFAKEKSVKKMAIVKS